MASILQMPNGNWRALVRNAQHLGHKPECKTFRTRAQAVAWAREREAAREAGEASPASNRYTVREVIQAYRALRESSGRPVRPTTNERYMLDTLQRHLGERIVVTLTPQDLVDFAAARKDEGAGPYTINMDLSKLGTVLRYAGAALRVAFPDIVGAARPLLTHLRLIGGGNRRERRPAGDELRRVLDYLREHHGPVYADAVEFAARSAMRRGEVTTLGFEELDARTRVVDVWRKHPRRGKVLERVPLLDDAWEIIQRQPRGEPEEVLVMTERGEEVVRKTRVFPIHPQTLSKYFRGACRELGVPDLRLHDMRHEGTSRLFELGYDIPEAALFSGHKDWRNLKRYTNLRPENVRRLSGEPHQSTPQRRGSRRSGGPTPGKS